MTLQEGGGIGWLRDLQPAALMALAKITDKARADLTGQRPRTSFGQNPDGSIFFTAVGVDRPFRVRYAFITREGQRHPTTGYEPESAVREACRIGPWDVNQLIEKLGSEDPSEILDVEEVTF